MDEVVKDGPRDDFPRVAGVAISSPDRLVFPDAGVTKLDLACYHDGMAGRILPGLANRPLSLLRLPEGMGGERFFQKHRGKGFPPGLKPVVIEESDGGRAEYMYVSDAAGLVGGVQMGTVEFHIWGSRRDRPGRPDRMVFDLDPGEGLGFPQVREAAVDLRDVLARCGLPAWPLVTGGKGIHVVVELRRTVDWSTVKRFAQTLATHLAESRPERFVAQMSKAKREGRIFIDWLRNERGATAIAPFSVRARPGAPVAVPVGWDELQSLGAANAFSLGAAREREFDATMLPGPVTLGRTAREALGRLTG